MSIKVKLDYIISDNAGNMLDAFTGFPRLNGKMKYVIRITFERDERDNSISLKVIKTQLTVAHEYNIQICV